MADHRSLDLTIISAKGLNKVNLVGKMDVYAVVSITGDQKQKTHVDKDGDSNPNWNFPMKFTIDESAALQNRLTLVVKIKTEGMFGDKDLGEVHVPIKELLDGVSAGGKPLQFVSYQVRKPSGKPKGELSFSYKFGEKTAGAGKVEAAAYSAYPAHSAYPAYPAYPAGKAEKVEEPVAAYPPAGKPNKVEEPVAAYPAGKAEKTDEPVTAYPAVAGSSSAYPPPYAAQGPYPPPAAAGGYPPAGAYPPAGGGYYPPPAGYPQGQAGYPYQHQQQPGYAGYPPAPGYGGYPPPAAGYGGYPPPGQVQQPQQAKKKSKFGMGLGAGLLGGALGGLLIGDMVSDGGGCGGCGGGCGGL